ncbi:hypothetical protein JCM10449v2_002052 [Rhodotorula kratochvilovae]
MASPLPTAEVLPLFGPSTLSPTRIFASFVVLLAVLLITRFSPRREPVALRAKRTSGARTVLLAGPLASGKTALFSKLVYGHAPQTHTSMKENEAVVKAKWGAGVAASEGEKGEKEQLLDEGDELPAAPLPTPLHLVDLPGHARLRTRALAQYLPAADGVVFAVDGQSGLAGKNVREAGEHFHILLSLLSLLPSSAPLPSLLILLTKSDLLPSSASSTPASQQLALDRAKSLLLRELERRRLAASGAGGAASAGGKAPLSAGARLEGLEAIAPSSEGSSRGVLSSLLSALGLGPAPATRVESSSNSGGGGLPSDESEALALGADEVWAFEGAATWDKIERALGVQIEWRVGSVKSREGLEGVWEWVEGL